MNAFFHRFFFGNLLCKPAGALQKTKMVVFLSLIHILLEYCCKYRTHILISSDAHICFDVGNHDFARKLLEELAFPEDLIVNTSLEKLASFLPGKIQL